MFWIILALVFPAVCIMYSERSYKRRQEFDIKKEFKPQNNHLSKRHNR